MLFCFADELGHSSHGAVYAPAAGLKQHHGNESQYGGGQHHAVKSKGKLGCAGMEQSSVVGPVPWKLKDPQERHNLL